MSSGTGPEEGKFGGDVPRDEKETSSLSRGADRGAGEKQDRSRVSGGKGAFLERLSSSLERILKGSRGVT